MSRTSPLPKQHPRGDDKATANADDLCYLKVSIAGIIQSQSIVIKLDKQNCPKTCQNFVSLCSTSKETTTRQNPIPSYRGCIFHRIIDNFMVQTGDFENFDGTGGYCVVKNHDEANHSLSFDDEYLKGKHDGPGIVSMANAGKNTNKSQFFITLKATPHLDGKHVIFGKVISGMETVQKMTTVERGPKDRPVAIQKIVICDCGTGYGQLQENYSSSSSISEKDERTRKHHKKEGRKEKKKRKKKHKRQHHDSSRKSKKRHRKREDLQFGDDSDESFSDEESRLARHRSSSRSSNKKRKKGRHNRQHHDDDNSDSSADDESYVSSSSSSSSVSRKHHTSRSHKKHSKKRRKKHHYR